MILYPLRGVVENGAVRMREKYDYLLELSRRAQALERQGKGLLEITHRLLGKESLLSLLTGHNFSKRNLVASSLEVDLSRYREQAEWNPRAGTRLRPACIAGRASVGNIATADFGLEVGQVNS